MQNLEDFRTLWNNQLESYFDHYFQKPTNRNSLRILMMEFSGKTKIQGPEWQFSDFQEIGFLSCRVTLSMKDCDWDAPETVSVVSETFDFLLGILEI